MNKSSLVEKPLNQNRRIILERTIRLLKHQGHRAIAEALEKNEVFAQHLLERVIMRSNSKNGLVRALASEALSYGRRDQFTTMEYPLLGSFSVVSSGGVL